jgi:hypothetical protein
MLRLTSLFPPKKSEPEVFFKLDDYEWRQEATVKALLAVLGLKEMDDGNTS